MCNERCEAAVKRQRGGGEVFGHVYRVSPEGIRDRPWKSPGVVFEFGPAPEDDGGVMQYLNLYTAPPSASVGVEGFRAAVEKARRVWMDENPCEDGHDHVTPFDQFLYSALAQQPTACPKCDGTGEADSGGIMPWGAPATIPCDCQQPAYAPVIDHARSTAQVPLELDLRYFKYGHLPAHLQTVSQKFGDLAQELNEQFPEGPEKSAGLRKLLEAKDCFVRASL